MNEEEIAGLLEWAHGRGMDLTVIEVMPLGDVDESRLDQYLPLSIVRARLAEQYTLEEIDYLTGGPARYVRVKETGGRLGFITPLTHNFCESCNRVRITCTGTLYMCLGQNDAADLRGPLRASESDDLLYAAIDEAITRKPKGHDFVIDRRPSEPGVAAPYEHDRRLALDPGTRVLDLSPPGSQKHRRRLRHRRPNDANHCLSGIFFKVDLSPPWVSVNRHGNWCWRPDTGPKRRSAGSALRPNSPLTPYAGIGLRWWAWPYGQAWGQ